MADLEGAKVLPAEGAGDAGLSLRALVVSPDLHALEVDALPTTVPANGHGQARLSMAHRSWASHQWTYLQKVNFCGLSSSSS